jgi:hypothetical protein
MRDVYGRHIGRGCVSGERVRAETPDRMAFGQYVRMVGDATGCGAGGAGAGLVRATFRCLGVSLWRLPPRGYRQSDLVHGQSAPASPGQTQRSPASPAGGPDAGCVRLFREREVGDTMAGPSEPSGADPPEPAGSREPAAAQILGLVRPALCLLIEVAEAGHHKGPAWLLRGLVWVTDLAVLCFGCRRR